MTIKVKQSRASLGGGTSPECWTKRGAVPPGPLLWRRTVRGALTAAPPFAPRSTAGPGLTVLSPPRSAWCFRYRKRSVNLLDKQASHSPELHPCRVGTFAGEGAKPGSTDAHASIPLRLTSEPRAPGGQAVASR